jgi:alpha-mannosidase
MNQSVSTCREYCRVNVLASLAGFDIQYGHVFRSTHRNTSWDMARFEVVGHRFADLSQGDCGVALLNNCKYGYKVVGNTLDLNLLRSPVYPDAEADRGRHLFTYRLLPHTGNLIESDVFAEAAMLNQGISVFSGFEGRGFELPFSLSEEGVTVEVLKKAEREECLILRAYEHRGCAMPLPMPREAPVIRATLSFSFIRTSSGVLH